MLFVSLEACKGGYDSCVQKINDSDTLQGDSLLIPVKNHKRLIYSRETPNAKILKHDPFLSLYLVEDKTHFAYPFDINMRLQLGRAAVDNKKAVEGEITHHQIGLNTLALWSEAIDTPALLTSSCCSLEGIVTPSGIIEKEYIRRFLSQQSSEYSDIGIRVKQSQRRVVVSASDPYLHKNPFKKGDTILALNGKRVSSAALFMREILFSKIGTKHTIRIQRSGKSIDVEVLSHKRYGGGAISDTFLESKGIYFDRELHIVKLSDNFKEYGMLVGDRLVQVNGVTIKTQEELLRYIEDFKDFSTLLFERRNFQFFVKIK